MRTFFAIIIIAFCGLSLPAQTKQSAQKPKTAQQTPAKKTTAAPAKPVQNISKTAQSQPKPTNKPVQQKKVVPAANQKAAPAANKSINKASTSTTNAKKPVTQNGQTTKPSSATNKGTNAPAVKTPAQPSKNSSTPQKNKPVTTPAKNTQQQGKTPAQSTRTNAQQNKTTNQSTKPNTPQNKSATQPAKTNQGQAKTQAPNKTKQGEAATTQSSTTNKKNATVQKPAAQGNKTTPQAARKQPSNQPAKPNQSGKPASTTPGNTGTSQAKAANGGRVIPNTQPAVPKTPNRNTQPAQVGKGTSPTSLNKTAEKKPSANPAPKQTQAAPRNNAEATAKDKASLINLGTKTATKPQKSIAVPATGLGAHKGKLPMPVNGSYSISARFGNHNACDYNGVTLFNDGIDIRAKGQATARNIYEGVVSAIYAFGERYSVIVRHGSFLSIYSNLSSVSVKEGERLKSKETIGRVGHDASGSHTLHFQIRYERQKLNPEEWLDM